MTLTLRFFAAVPALIAACAMPASAAFTSSSNPVRTLFHHSGASPIKTQYVAIEFRNVSPQQRTVQVGDTQFSLAAGAHAKVSVAVGSQVKVRSAINSKVDGSELMTVKDATEGQEVLVN